MTTTTHTTVLKRGGEESTKPARYRTDKHASAYASSKLAGETWDEVGREMCKHINHATAKIED